MTKDTTPSAKEQVLAWVRSKNPQTMELKEGCKVQYMSVVYGITESYGGQIDYWDYRYFYLPCDSGEFSPDKIPRKGKNAAVILGSDMGLQELLIALMKIPIGLSMDTTGKLYISNCSCIQGSGREKFIFDLTKTLHNQNDSFYEALLPLIK